MTQQEIEVALEKLSYWVKIERCDFSSNEAVLKMLYEKFENLYKLTIGAKNLYVPPENIDLNMIDLENFGDTEKIEDEISAILKFINKEEFLQMNRIFFYCMRISDGDFQFADFNRNLKSLQVTPLRPLRPNLTFSRETTSNAKPCSSSASLTPTVTSRSPRSR